MTCDFGLREYIDQELTYVIPDQNPNRPPQIIKNMAIIREDLISIPVGRMDLIPEDYEIVNKRVSIPVDFPKFEGVLRPNQDLIYRAVTGDAIINAWTGWGKTFTTLAIAEKLKQKTLIVVHTLALRNQWEREIKKVMGMSPGVIGSGRFDIDKPICVGNIQTLYRNVAEVKRAFGTFVLDEVHHCPARTFSHLVDTSHAANKIGLSATIERKDGKHVVIKDYFGQDFFKPPKSNFMAPDIHIIRTSVRFMDGANIPWAHRVTALTQQQVYLELMAILALSYAEKGHKVLLVADRVAFLKNIAELIGDRAVCITGELDFDEREARLDKIRKGEASILCGIRSIFSEGISEDHLSCLILGTPINNDPLLEQLIGRVTREVPGKIRPVVVDPHLVGNTARRQASNRMGYYMRQGYDIKEIVM